LPEVSPLGGSESERPANQQLEPTAGDVVREFDDQPPRLNCGRWADFMNGRAVQTTPARLSGWRRLEMKGAQVVVALAVVVASVQLSQARSQVAVGGSRGVEASAIAGLEEQFRLAKLQNDVSTLSRILDEGFVETNQNGTVRDKTEMLALFEAFPISSLTTDSSTVRLTENAAVVTGSQTEVNATGTDRMLFTRVYVNSQGRWRLLSSAQSRAPRPFMVVAR
jgi:hypothetical protein